MAKEHAKKAEAFEAKLQRNLKEKHEAMEATYKEEMQRYRATGKTNRKSMIVHV